MNEKANDKVVGGIREMEAAIDRFEQELAKINTAGDAFARAVADLKAAKAYTAADAEKLAELHDRANAMFKRAAELHRRDRGYIKQVRDHARTINQWMHERAKQARESAAELEPTVEAKADPAVSASETAPPASDLVGFGIELDAKTLDALTGGGVTTREQFVAMVQAGTLTDIKGIGKSTAAKIKEALTDSAG